MAFFSGGNDRIKLMTLYVLRAFRTPVAWEQLYTALSENGEPRFFELGEIYTELAAEGYLVSVPAGGRQLVQLTEKGRSTCELFMNELAKSQRDAIDAYAEEHREAFRRSNSVVARLDPLPSGGYEAVLSLLDATGALAEVKLRLPTSEYASRARQNWLDNAESLYRELMLTLTREPEA